MIRIKKTIFWIIWIKWIIFQIIKIIKIIRIKTDIVRTRKDDFS